MSEVVKDLNATIAISSLRTGATARTTLVPFAV